MTKPTPFHLLTTQSCDVSPHAATRRAARILVAMALADWLASEELPTPTPSARPMPKARMTSTPTRKT